MNAYLSLTYAELSAFTGAVLAAWLFFSVALHSKMVSEPSQTASGDNSENLEGSGLVTSKGMIRTFAVLTVISWLAAAYFLNQAAQITVLP